jgi:hypothetical protein
MDEIKDNFINNEKLITNKIYENIKLYEINHLEVNIGYTIKEREFLIKIFVILKNALPNIKNNTLCMTIIYTYYGLVLGEQTEDFLFISDLYCFLSYSDAKNVIELFLILTTGTLIFNNIDLASKIRRSMLFDEKL